MNNSKSSKEKIIDEIDKIFLDKSLSTGQKIILIGSRKDLFKLAKKRIKKNSTIVISFDKQKCVFSELEIIEITNYCKNVYNKLKNMNNENRATVE
jgi:hypothetical protein